MPLDARRLHGSWLMRHMGLFTAAAPTAALLLLVPPHPAAFRAPLTSPSSTPCLATCTAPTRHWSEPASCSSLAGGCLSAARVLLGAALEWTPGHRIWLPATCRPLALLAQSALRTHLHRRPSCCICCPMLLPHPAAPSCCPGSHLVISHPLGRRWHEKFRAANPELVPHALPDVRHPCACFCC